MKSDDKRFIACMGVIIAIIIGGYASLVSYTGLNAPFSVIMSESMQHDNQRSEIGIIDTGDVVIVENKDRSDIQSYIESTVSGYSTFGDFGSVIIYNRDSPSNPVIHRAILWLDYDPSTDTWNAPSLNDYRGSWYWEYMGVKHTETTGIRGILHFDDITQSHKCPSIDLDRLNIEDKKSGYLTMGDNTRNVTFDQGTSIVSHMIGIEDIRSVPIMEIPWIGTIKLLFKNESKLECVTNSIPSLAMLFLIVIAFFSVLDIFGIMSDKNKAKRRRQKFRKI